MIEYDFAILGGGAAGLSLALALARSSLSNRSILVVEKEHKQRNDRTWCYWARNCDPFDDIRYHAWENIQFINHGVDLTQPIKPYRYQMIRGIDYYNYMRQELAKFHNVRLVNGMVNGWVDGGESVEIRIDGEAYRASWVFDSRYKPAEPNIESKKFHHLMQHFRGWEIETIDPVFDPAVATLFDLRTAQLDGLRFFYILPFSQRRALIEYTIFSQALLPQEEYEQALSDYIQRQLSVKEYQIMEVETGIIPMTDYSFPRRLGQRVLSIGTLGGRVKPSTGYAFSRIQRDTQAIVKSLVRLNHPFDIPSDPRKSLFYDSLMLDVMVNHPDMVEKILTKMFSRNPIQRAIEFLDEHTQIWEDILLIASLPPVPFLRALGNRLRF